MTPPPKPEDDVAITAEDRLLVPERITSPCRRMPTVHATALTGVLAAGVWSLPAAMDLRVRFHPGAVAEEPGIFAP
ncbi:MAG: hypothetical protein ACI8RZ_000667 [Myxococcota bacterium]|jgi:hypothetical protein